MFGFMARGNVACYTMSVIIFSAKGVVALKFEPNYARRHIRRMLADIEK